MPGSPHGMDTDSNWEPNDTAYQIMCLIKRPAYEFALTVPKVHPFFQSAERAFVQVRFKDRRQSHSLMLNWGELEDLYQSLSQLVEYVRTERERRRQPW